MKVTIVGNFGLWNKGTMGARALPMAKALVARGHEVCMVLPPWDAPKESGREYIIDGVKIINVALPPNIPLLWHGLLTIALLIRALREPSDIFHIFKPKAYAGFVGIWLWLLQRLRLCRARLVVDTDDWEGAGGWNEIETFPTPIKWFISWHERAVLRCGDAVTVASRALELLTWSLGVSRACVYYVPNGVDQYAKRDLDSRSLPASGIARSQESLALSSKEADVPPALAACADHSIVLLFTRFFEFRPEKMVRLWQRIVACHPKARLLIVGKGLWREEELLAEQLRDAGLTGSAIFAGWVQQADMSQWLAAADVAIYPMDDNLLNRAKCPMKLVDLMSHGLPVVAERVGQVSEYIEDGASGLLVEPDDINAFAAAVSKLLSDSAKRAALGAGAQSRIIGRFGWSDLTLQVERAYGLSLQSQPDSLADPDHDDVARGEMAKPLS